MPVNIDPEFHYEAINVEVQETNLSSFLWWMRRVISIRKRFPAFGHGDLQMLTPTNNKVLAFTRTYDTQTILVVVNLSRFSQAVDLDLPNFIGWIPEDTFGHGRFPVIRDNKYTITLGAHTSFWLLLTPPDVFANGNISSGGPLPGRRLKGRRRAKALRSGLNQLSTQTAYRFQERRHPRRAPISPV